MRELVIATIKDELNLLIDDLEIKNNNAYSDKMLSAQLRDLNFHVGRSDLIETPIKCIRKEIAQNRSEHATVIVAHLKNLENVLKANHESDEALCKAIRQVFADDPAQRNNEVSTYQTIPLGPSGSAGSEMTSPVKDNRTMTLEDPQPMVNKTTLQPNTDLSGKLQGSYKLVQDLNSNLEEIYALALKNQMYSSSKEHMGLSLNITGSLRRLKFIQNLLEDMMFKADRK